MKKFDNNGIAKEKEHNLKFQVLMNMHYHEILELRYTNLLNWAAFLSILFSSASFFAIGDLIPNSYYLYKNSVLILFTFFVFSYNAFILSFGVLQKTIQHRDFKKKMVRFIWTSTINKYLNIARNFAIFRETIDTQNLYSNQVINNLILKALRYKT